jgi:hypothetical protein
MSRHHKVYKQNQGSPYHKWGKEERYYGNSLFGYLTIWLKFPERGKGSYSDATNSADFIKTGRRP